MKLWKKLALGTAVVVLAAGGGAAAARQASGPGDPDAAPAPSIARGLKDTGGGVTESKYIPITPCRIVDTRAAGGQIGNNQSRNFKARGTTGFTAQGGKSGGCGVPTQATAIEVAVTTVDSTGGGYMRIYPFGKSEPTATFINYSPYNPTNTGAVTLCTSSCGGGDITARGHGTSTDVVMDVQGYYIKPMTAWINASGSTGLSSRLTGVSHSATGVYRLAWDRDVSGCTAVASPYYNNYDITAVQTEGPNSILVVIQQRSNDTNVDSPFMIQVTC